MRWLDLRGWLFCHVPNGGKRNKLEAVLLARMGVRAGVSDLLIFSPPPRRPGRVGTALEMKAPKGPKQGTPAQREWLERLDAVGWCTLTCRGAGDAIAALTALGY